MNDSARIKHNLKIAAYYDETILVYKYWWSDPKTLSSHAGIWEKGVRTHQEAHQVHNRLLAQRAAISARDRVLDAGCGLGGSAFFLAETYGAHVEGISLSSAQLREARRAAAQRHLEHFVTFSQQDYVETNFASGSFDVVWAFESVCHAPHKRLFLEEAFRVLRPGGRLVMADYFRRSRSWAADDEKYFHLAVDGSAVHDLDTPDEFFNSMQDVGFQDISFEERTDQIEPSLRKLYHFSLLTLPIAWVGHRLGLMSQTLLDGSISNFWQYEACRRRLVPYIVLLGHKPSKASI
jgi:cyclopropane fatty-acyl-phospholipid synthase-like methyltransferase